RQPVDWRCFSRPAALRRSLSPPGTFRYRRSWITSRWSANSGSLLIAAQAYQAVLQEPVVGRRTYRGWIDERDPVSHGPTLAQAQYLDLQSRLDALARSAYMSGPGAGLEVVLGARSMTDLNERIQFLAAATEQDSILATQVGGVATTLGQRKSHLQTLLARQ